MKTFLEQLRPAGGWCLVGIHPGGGQGTQARWFTTSAAAEAWARKLNDDGWNLYFTLNGTEAIGKKPTREEITELAWLHVDLDPAEGEDLDEARERMLSALWNPPGDVPAPTAIIFTGNGYQAIWRLETPIALDGTLTAAEDAKLWNVQLERLFGADACHNIDRLLRLPGSLNYPTPKKVKKYGRTEPTRSELVEFHTDRAYPIERFTKAIPVSPPLLAAPGVPAAAAPAVALAAVKRLNVDELEDRFGPNDRLRALVVTGKDPVEPRKYTSRSESLFAAVCGMVRAGFDDQTIYAIITDPDLAISESVIDKGNTTQRYALRQISNARRAAAGDLVEADPEDAAAQLGPFDQRAWMKRLNDKHAVISNSGGSCCVVEEQYDFGMDRHRLVRQSVTDFRNRYCNRKIADGSDAKGNDIFKPLGKWWFEHEERRQYETITFAPGKDTPDCYNLWRGFAVEPLPGDKHERWLEHVRTHVCNGNASHFDYLIKWLATCVQNPAAPGHTAVVLRGKQGTGKGIFAKTFGSLWGRHFMQVSSSKHLVGNFNSHLRDCVVMFADEAFYAGDKKNEGVLKTLVTEETLTIEAKGVDVETTPNYLHIIMASNSNWVVPADIQDRRFFVLDVNPEAKENTEYFKAIRADLEEGGRENLLHYLQTLDLTGFNVRDLPKTDALHDQKLMSLGPEESWWYGKLCDGRLLKSHSDWDKWSSKDNLYRDYVATSRDVGVNRRGTETMLGRFLSRVMPRGWPKSRRRRIEIEEADARGELRLVPYRVPVWEFPPLDICRDHWNLEYGGSWDFPEIEPEEPEPNMGAF